MDNANTTPELQKHSLRRGWRKEARVLKEIGLRVNFERNGTWLEVEFGNARGYYQDYIKFALADRYQSAACGILLCPTESFAHLLCELGRKARRDETRGDRIQDACLLRHDDLRKGRSRTAASGFRPERSNYRWWDSPKPP